MRVKQESFISTGSFQLTFSSEAFAVGRYRDSTRSSLQRGGSPLYPSNILALIGFEPMNLYFKLYITQELFALSPNSKNKKNRTIPNVWYHSLSVYFGSHTKAEMKIQTIELVKQIFFVQVSNSAV